MGLWVCRAGKAGMDLAHASIAAEDERRGPAVQVFRLRNLFIQLVRRTSDQDWIGNSVALNKSAKTRGILELIILFEAEIDNLQAFGVKLLVEVLQKRSFVMAVWAP